jgi:hypothetical protein
MGGEPGRRALAPEQSRPDGYSVRPGRLGKAHENPGFRWLTFAFPRSVKFEAKLYELLIQAWLNVLTLAGNSMDPTLHPTLFANTKILVIDDEHHMRKVVRTLLMSIGVRTI